MIFCEIERGCNRIPFFCPITECKTSLSKRYIYMIHLKPSDATKSFEIITRTNTIDLLTTFIRDEQTNETVEYDLTYTIDPNTQYVIVSGEIDVIEGHTYEIKLQKTDTNLDVFKGKIFATDQTIDQSDNERYSINDGEYTEHSNENEFIIL